MQSRVQREGSETEQFWYSLGGKSEYPSQKLVRETETDPHLFSSSFSQGKYQICFIFSLLIPYLVSTLEINLL